MAQQRLASRTRISNLDKKCCEIMRADLNNSKPPRVTCDRKCKEIKIVLAKQPKAQLCYQPWSLKEQCC